MRKAIGIISTCVAITLLVLFLPIPKGTLNDGGTRVYSALTYKIVWFEYLAANIRIEFRLERNLADFFDGSDIMEPQILRIKLIFNKLQILQIKQIEFLNAQAHELARIAWRKKRNLLIIYSKNLLRIYSLPPWRNMIFWTADFADDADFTQIGFLDAHPSTSSGTAHELIRIG